MFESESSGKSASRTSKSMSPMRSIMSTTSSIQRKIKNYDRLKLITQILFGLFLVIGIAYAVMAITDSQVSYDNIRLEENVASSPDGKIVALSITKDNKRSILVSTDSGRNFTIEGGPWDVIDSAASLLITPDSKAIIVTDGSGNYYINEAPFARFSKYKISASAGDTLYAVKGAFYNTRSQRVYLFGNMPFIARFALADPYAKQNFALPTAEYTVTSLAVNTDDTKAEAIAVSDNTPAIIWSIPLNSDYYTEPNNSPGSSSYVPDTTATTTDSTAAQMKDSSQMQQSSPVQKSISKPIRKS